MREKVLWIVAKEAGRSIESVYYDLTYRQTIGYLSASVWYRNMMTPKHDEIGELKAKALADFNHYNNQGML